MYHEDDDGAVWAQTEIECPFCWHYVEWVFDHMECGYCDVCWPDAAAVERDREQQQPRDELSDRDMFDRSLRVGGPRW